MDFEKEIEKLQNPKLLKRAFIRGCSEKICKCEDRTILVDESNHILECSECGAILDPFKVISDFAYNESLYFNNLEAMHEEKKELTKWMKSNKMGSLLREWASQLRSNLLPHCPSCKQIIDVYKVGSWSHIDYLKK